MTLTINQHNETKTEEGIQRALLRHFDWMANPCFINCMHMPWESDFITLSKSRYVTEVEIKISWADWKADMQKDKWTKFKQHLPRVKFFWYAVPAEIIEKHGLPEGMPEGAGVLLLRHDKLKGINALGRLRVYVHTQSIARPGAKPMTDAELMKMYRSHYFRSTKRFMREPKR